MRIECFEKRVYEIRMSKEDYDMYSGKIFAHIKSLPNLKEWSESGGLGEREISWTVLEEKWEPFECLGEAV